MSLKAIDVLLALATAAAAVAGARWAAAPSSAPRTAAAGSIAVETYAPEYSPCRAEPSADGRTARVGFDLDAGETLVGLSSARVFPISGPRLAVAGWDDVVTAHVVGGLDLSTWVEKRSPSGPHALFFALRIDGSMGRETRIGWARFEGSDLRFANLSVRCLADRRCRIDVTTASDQHVPGALLSLSPPVYRDGVVSALAVTGVDGACLVSGLGRQAWTAALPEGVGPDRAPQRAPIAPTATRATLRSALRGGWTFVESAVDLPALGGSLVVGNVRAAGRGPGAWPVSPFVLPGTGRRRPWTWMLPVTSGSSTAPVVATFRGFGAVSIEDAGRPFLVRETSRGLVTEPAAAPR